MNPDISIRYRLYWSALSKVRSTFSVPLNSLPENYFTTEKYLTDVFPESRVKNG